ncbi:drug resistance transporter, EmrB/QacA subfamily [Microbacterium azadirachtae]|uniref:Drug resistance transporter, EmrB/QacA subfamily n=1 Tax=Microbacterium azadirachtae TaxID=582680 RepID=A0A1I6J276_9MICO|nr:MFS transporter [Microbacterium azadirachtae]SFR73039.1 drug resistance transporter, EmrB/QacA subfamily [Microbacterium azadirachtae]
MTTTSSRPAAPRAASTARERIALLILLTAGFTLAVDFSILTVALPRIGRDVGIPTANLQWIATSYALCAAGFTLLFGRVADLVGRKRMFLIGMALLGAASLGGGLAGEPILLLTARVAQGLATAMVTPAALSLLTTAFPEGPARDRALGLNGALMAAGFTTGAVLGGVLTDALSWRWAFFLNVAVAAVVLCLAPAVLRESRAAHRSRLDLPGALTVTLGLVAIVYGATSAGRYGWASPLVWACFAVAVLALLAFWLIERRVPNPLVAMSLLRMPNVAWGNAAGVVAFATETALVFPLTLYLQEVLGIPPLLAGLSFGVLGVGTVLGGLLAPRLIGRAGARRAIALGFAVQAVATAPLAFVGAESAWVVPLLALTFVGGVANLVAIVGYVVASTTGIPDGQQGLATGLVTLSQQIGIALGTPVLAAIVAGGAASGAHGLLPGIRAAVLVDALACGVAAIVAGVLGARTRSGR